MTIQEQLNRQGKQHIIDLAHVTHDLWGKMMQDVSLPSDTKFVDEEVIKPSKYYQFYNRAITQLWEAQQAYAAGGYVGLHINKRGRAGTGPKLQSC